MSRTVSALPEVVVDLARLPLLVQLPLLAQLPVLALLEVVVDLARPPLLVQLPEEVAVEVVPVVATRSFSAAMVGILPPPGPPMYAPVPRSGRKAKRRPCPLA